MVSSIYSYHWWLPAIYFFHLERVKQDLRFAQPGPLLANEQYRESNHMYIACCTLQPQHALRACHRSTMRQVEKYILVVQNFYGSLWLYVTRIIFFQRYRMSTSYNKRNECIVNFNFNFREIYKEWRKCVV